MKNKVKKPIGKKRNRQQKHTKYRLTVAEHRLLEVLLDPEHRLKSVTDKCLLAKVNRTVYYKAFKKEGFCEFYDRESAALIRKAKSAIINASIHQALRGDAPHAKMLLSMDGIYQGDKHIFPGKDGKPQDLGFNKLSENEVARRISLILQKGLKRKEAAEKKNATGK